MGCRPLTLVSLCFLIPSCGGDDSSDPGTPRPDAGADAPAETSAEAGHDAVGEAAAEGSGGGTCGDNTQDPGEACDDGNQLDGDGCSSTCSETTCADAGGQACGQGQQCPGSIVPAADTTACCSVACEEVASIVVFVDNTLSEDTCDDYDPTSRTCGSGQDRAYGSLALATAEAEAGWAVYIRGGTYDEPLEVQHSGVAGAHLVFSRYADEDVIITGTSLEPAVDLSGREYVIVDGLTIDEVKRWLYAVDTHHCVLRNNTFTRAIDAGGSSKTGVFFQDATYNRIVDNTIEDSTQDNLALHHCDHNLVAGNTIRTAAHTLWAIKCGSYNVVRDNHFENADQKIGEIYDCDASGFDHEITMYDATKYNVVEGNTFALAVKYYSISGGNGIQNAGQHGIIRRNVFHDTNAGLGLQRYSDEANHDTHNRAYHNVFHANECGGAGLGQGSSEQFDDNELVNNIFFENVGCEQAGEAQIIYRALAGFSFRNNLIRGSTSGAAVIQELGGSAGTLAQFETDHPELFVDNVDDEPGFVDVAAHDYQLQSGSASIDRGAFLTRAVGAGTSTLLHVVDSGYFSDGNGVEGELGDLIQVEGHGERARVLSIDRAAGTLTLDLPLAWEDGDGVSLAYEGAAPDLGAFER